MTIPKSALWALPAALIVAIAIAAFRLYAPAAADPELFIRPVIAHQQAVADQRTLFDIRTPEEWSQTGVPQGAVTADFNALDAEGRFVERVLAMVGGDKDRPVALICARGGRSARAAAMLREAGFSDVRDVQEGMLGNGRSPGWIAGGLPTMRWKDRREPPPPSPPGF